MKKALTTVMLLLALNTHGQRVNLYDPDRESAMVLTLGGVSFTVASILQGGYQYGTWVDNPTPKNPGNQTYVIPPFHKQTTRFITFSVGVTLTISGLIGLKQ